MADLDAGSCCDDPFFDRYELFIVARRRRLVLLMFRSIFERSEV